MKLLGIILVILSFVTQRIEAYSMTAFSVFEATGNCIRCDLTDSIYIKKDLRRSKLKDSNLKGSNLSLSDLSKSDLSLTDMKNVNMTNTTAMRSDFSFSDLSS